MLKPFVVTIDGPAGAGKSSITKALAAKLSLPMLDTGAMYRTLGIKLGAEIMDMSDEQIAKKARKLIFYLEGNGADVELICNDEKVSDLPIRTEKASRLSSLVAKHPVIRKVLQENQVNIGKQTSLIVEGRDMGTKVFPQAQCKIYLEASPQIRAQRRYDELVTKGETPNFDMLYEELVKRDMQDSLRECDPLKPADDAYIFDTSRHNFDEVLEHLYTYIIEKKSLQVEESFTHLDSNGNACMVDVGDKVPTKRIAVVGCRVEVNENTMALLKQNALPKGDVLTTAKIAGILAAKQTSSLIPMCHPLAISYADIRFKIIDSPPAIEVEAEIHTTDRTGVEMEALIAAQVTAATIYDMCKAVQKDICINECRLLSKSGGKSEYVYSPSVK